jgi:hypothetical protein
MPKFVTIGYGDEAGYQRTAPDVRDAAHAHDQKLKQRGAVMGIAASPSRFAIPIAPEFGLRTLLSCHRRFLSQASA